MKKVLILFSGGADSIQLLLLAHARAKKQCSPQEGRSLEIGVITFDYGQIHRQELDVARRFLNNHPDFYDYGYEMKISFEGTTSPLLEGKWCHPRDGVHVNHVPARNLVFISHAASIAESHGYDEIWYGADYSDRVNLFPDCTQEWVVAMNAVLAINGSKKIRLVAPLLGMTKEDIVSINRDAGVCEEEVFSGYGG